jgi:hypothetical protein
VARPTYVWRNRPFDERKLPVRLRKTGISTIAIAVALTILSIPVVSAARNEEDAKAAQVVLGCAHKKTGRLRVVRSTRACRLRRERVVR